MITGDVSGAMDLSSLAASLPEPVGCYAAVASDQWGKKKQGFRNHASGSRKKEAAAV
jgi:hypothetical protein